MKKQQIILIIIFLLKIGVFYAQENIKSSLSAEAREQFIQKALQFRKDENYLSAAQQLDNILTHNSVDASALLFKGDLLLQGRRFADAAKTYQQLLPLNFEKTIVQINLSYALFMNHQPKKALNFAQAAWQQNKTNTNAVVNYFNAMLWNIKTKEASVFLNEQESVLSEAQQMVLKARLHTTSGNYSKGLQYYDSLVQCYPDKYYVKEYAEVLLGKKEIQLSENTMKASEKLFSANEYNAFLQKLKATQLQNAGTEFVYFKDIAKNIRIENSLWWQQEEGKKIRFRLSVGSSIITSQEQEKTKAEFAHINIAERWNKSWSGETDIHIQVIKPSNSQHFTGLTGKQSIQYQPNDRRMLGVFYSADILNFTASLLEKNIRSNNVGYVTHIMLGGKTGIYSQGSTGVLSDKNQRYLFFGSLYHLFRTEPTLKGGINFSQLHYSNNTVKTYFSPNRYLNTEAFVDFSSALPMLSKFYIQTQAAAGMQKIEQQKWTSAMRFQSEVGFRQKHFDAALKYQTSNVASSTGTGYQFDWYTLRVMWKW